MAATPTPLTPRVEWERAKYGKGNTNLFCLQLMMPDEFRGRVMALWGMMHSCIQPVGEMQFAVVAALTTSTFVLVVGGLVVIAFILLITLPNRKLCGLNITEAYAPKTESASPWG